MVRYPAIALFLALATLGNTPAADKPAPPRFPPLDNAAAWKRLPQEQPALPVWARVLTRSLPKTAAAMLRLDYVHRAKNPLDPVLRGKLRWAAAIANRCEYSTWYAAADLRRAGMKPEEWKTLTGDWKKLPAKERIALRFAQKMTTASHSVTDAEFAALLKEYGPEKTVAIVHTVAHANFQDRIFLALEIDVEKDGPLPSRHVPLDAERLYKVPVPKRPEWKTVVTLKIPAADVKPAWKPRGREALQKLLDAQKARKSRIPFPPVKKAGDAASPRVAWADVSLGYQPLLATEWFNTTAIFEEEAAIDYVFANSLFWVIARRGECYYSLGQSEMLLEVAGLKPPEIRVRVKNLEQNWAAFSPAERLAMQFAQKQSRDPLSVTAKEMDALVKAFGRHRTIDLVWHAAWCGYMTQVANVLQLPLERENVFLEPPQNRPPVRARKPKR